MKISTFQSLITVISIASVSLIACKKEISSDSLIKNQNSVVLRSYSSVVNNTKQDRKILFVSYRDDINGEIYAMNADGSNLVRLTFNTVPDGRATWSSNGQHIAFSRGPAGNRDIYVMNANGNGLQNITNTGGKDEEWPDWSAQGNKVIFSSNSDAVKHEIYIYDFDNGSTTRLTFREDQDDRWPTFSPDGSKITFQSNLAPATGQTDVFVMNTDGSNVTRLTNTTFLDQMPTWSPDGNKIAFMSNRDGNPEIYVMNADGTNQTRLTNYPGIDARPSWSKETGIISFTSTRDFGTTATGNYEIYKMNGDGSNAVRLTNNSIYDDYPFIK